MYVIKKQPSYRLVILYYILRLFLDTRFITLLGRGRGFSQVSIYKLFRDLNFTRDIIMVITKTSQFCAVALGLNCVVTEPFQLQNEQRNF